MNLSRQFFFHELKKALTHLYDPGVLRHSPLISLLQLDAELDSASLLCDRLNKSIEMLRPKAEIPVESNAWRLYNILFYRYTEQSSQSEVASDMALSIRQLRRQEKIALEMLVDFLWDEYKLQDVTQGGFLPNSIDAKLLPESRMPSRDEELAWLNQNTPFEIFDLHGVLLEVLKILAPIINDQTVAIDLIPSSEFPLIYGKRTAIRQALVNLLAVAIDYGYGGRVEIRLKPAYKKWHNQLEIMVENDKIHSINNKKNEDLKIAIKLIQLSKGDLIVRHSPEKKIIFYADVIFINNENIRVLALDDNVDTLNLLERYLSETRYKFVGTPNPEEFLSYCETRIPDIVILDVMLPGIDGWEILSRLRENPRTQNVILIISTILHQEQLAMALGATEFIHKPINREKLIAQLDRLTAPGMGK